MIHSDPWGAVVKRREFILALGGAAFGWTLAARAQTNRVPRIGILSSDPVASIYIKAFLQGLRDLGYVEGQNIIVERYASGQADQLTASAAELVKAGLDVIFTNGLEATRSAQQATTGIPIVAISSNPTGLGFVASLARPEGNITGVSLMAPESSGKRLELLKEIIPGVVNVAVLWNPSDPGAAGSLKETVAAADAIGLKLQILATTDGNSFDAAFEDAVKQSARAVVLLPAPLMGVHMQRIVDLALKYRLPTMYFASDLPKAGGLVSYGVNVVALFRRAAYYVDRILKGAKPADLLVEQPTKFELVINLKTAKALDLTVPPTLLARADEVIE
jgi:putative tryptophan/tyrosine transport system substrate-binding protein